MPSAHAQTPDVLINGGFEEQWTNSKEAFDWRPFVSGYTRVRRPHSGSWSIKLQNTSFGQSSGAFQRIDLNQEELKPVFIGGYVRGADIKNGPGGFFGASLYAEIHLKDGSVAYWNSIANFGSFSWRWVGFNTGTVALVDQPIDHILVVPVLINATGRAWFDDIVMSEYEPFQSAVTLMFDDGEDSVYSEAKPLLENLGFPGSVAVITDTINDPGFLTLPQIKALEDSGWEVISHSVTHRDLTTISRRGVTQELSQSKRTLERRGFTVSNFAMPFGAYNGEVLGLGQKYYSSMRAFELGDNPQGTFSYDVKVRGVRNTTTAEDVRAWLESARDNNRWMVLVFHKITETGDDAFHTTPETFKDIIDVVSEIGLDVVTYDEGLKMFRVEG